jgi:dolichyl-diphosphooligosaccharide---protein glycosyltransferase
MGYSGDDINKFLWMVRIAEGEHPNDIRESDYFTERGEFRVDAEGSPTLLNCLVSRNPSVIFSLRDSAQRVGS